jgi:hypothetical protein
MKKIAHSSQNYKNWTEISNPRVSRRKSKKDAWKKRKGFNYQAENP